jgi:hypothetical protein
VLQKPMEDLVDAFLYLRPQDLRLREKIPADIALDANYRAEFQRGAAMFGFPDVASKRPQEFDQQVVRSAEDPLFTIPKTQTQDPKEVKAWVQSCLEPQQPRQNIALIEDSAPTSRLAGSDRDCLRLTATR